MTTNSPGSVNQRPFFGCTSCFEHQTFSADHLRVFKGECWCDECWDVRKLDFDDQPYWCELPQFIPPPLAELDHLRELLAGCVEYLSHGSSLHRMLVSASEEGTKQ